MGRLVAFRADASPEIGAGHVMRCLTLAQALQAYGVACVLLGAPSTATWRREIESRGVAFVSLRLEAGALNVEREPSHSGWASWGQEADAAATAAALPRDPDWLIVDHYALDARWERLLRPHAPRIAALDDLANRSHDADLLLDQNLQTAGRYEGLLMSQARRLLGPRYALIRPAFAQARRGATLRGPQLRRIHVFMGGGDVGAPTLAAIEAVSGPALRDAALDVVIGAANRGQEAIARALSGRDNARLHVDTPDMARLMADADLGIGAGGGAALERCVVGLPSVTAPLAPNQEPGLRALEAQGATLVAPSASAADLGSAVEALACSSDRRRRMEEAALSVTDGHGADRVAAALMAEAAGVTVRLARPNDAALLLRWRNEPSVRALSFSQDEITEESHLAWFSRALADPSAVVLIGLVAGRPCGTVRWSVNGDVATASITVAPETQGVGLGSRLLEAARLDPALPGQAQLLHAWVKPENQPSRRLFETAGYAPVSEEPDRVLYARPRA
ncbi:UDP-2,4-diacetamido-2,4,6-trideoxy-beta-L-altropyranose hydrolase [Alsobacter soli]|nr:UDP-2,4-diacetamido-2,4,6-trideoxy-beta-L-altropyranose hydrolase [Alsobacter soli]